MSASSYTFDSPDADVIIRAPLHPDHPESTEFRDFHTHKIILSTASAIFRDMFSIPQPLQPTQGDATLPIVHVAESAETFELFLRLIYPIEPPAINSLRMVDHLSQLTAKYMVDCIRPRLKPALVSPSFLKNDPVWVYTIACRMDLNEEAELAISHTYRIDLVQDIPHTLLRAMTAEMYNRLLKSHATRREALISVLNRNKGLPSPYEGKCNCGPWFFTRLFKNIILAIWERPILDRQRLDLCLSKVEGMPKSGCTPGTPCRVSAQGTSAYFASILDAIEKLGQVSGN